MGYARTLSGLPEVVLPMAPTEALSEVSDLRAVATGAIFTKGKIVFKSENTGDGNTGYELMLMVVV